jgi:hypothetical protein
MNKKWIYLSASVVAILLSLWFLLFLRNCESKELNKVIEKEMPMAGKIEVGLKPTVTISPSDSDISIHDDRRSILEDGIRRIAGKVTNVSGGAATGIGSSSSTINSELHERSDISRENVSGLGGSTALQVRTGTIVPIQSLPTRTDNIGWNSTTGQLVYKWYGFAFAPGLSVIETGRTYGMDVNCRIAYIQDFGLQVGADFLKKEKASLSVSVGYNLRKIHMISNTDLVVGYDSHKTLFCGIRVELGQK